MPNAQAMTAPLPAGLAPIIQQANPVDEVQMAVAKCGQLLAAGISKLRGLTLSTGACRGQRHVRFHQYQ